VELRRTLLRRPGGRRGKNNDGQGEVGKSFYSRSIRIDYRERASSGRFGSSGRCNPAEREKHCGCYERGKDMIRVLMHPRDFVPISVIEPLLKLTPEDERDFKDEVMQGFKQIMGESLPGFYEEITRLYDDPGIT
jgi:hypothetical protein